MKGYMISRMKIQKGESLFNVHRTMLIILERDRFIKLFKFGELKVNISSFIDGYDTNDQYKKIPVELLEDKIPLFEQDHEVLILEVLKETLIIDFELTLRISQVRKIFPLTAEAKRFLTGKMNPLIVLHEPLFHEQVKQIKTNRDFKLRLRAKDSLFGIFGISKSLPLSYGQEVEQGVKDRISFADNSKKGTYLYHLLRFNRNPVYPAGSIEYLFKAASVFVEMRGGAEKDFESGPFYQLLQDNSRSLSGASLSECLTFVFKSKESEYLKSELTKQYPELDAFAVGAWFLYFKDKLNQNDYDLGVIAEEANSLKVSNLKEIALVLHMIGMLFSFDNLYESIYKMKRIPVFGQSPKPGLTEQQEELAGKLRAKEDEIGQLRKEIAEMKEAIAVTDEKQTTALVKIEQQVLKPELKNDLVKEKEVVCEKPEDKLGYNKVKERAKDSEQPKSRGKSATISQSRKTKTDDPSDKAAEKANEKKQSKTDGKNLELSFPNDFQAENKSHYNATELKKIVNSIKKGKLIANKNELSTVCEAILNYTNKGCNYDQLRNEIEVLKKDLGFSDDVAKELRNIILEVK